MTIEYDNIYNISPNIYLQLMADTGPPSQVDTSSFTNALTDVEQALSTEATLKHSRVWALPGSEINSQEELPVTSHALLIEKLTREKLELTVNSTASNP